MSDPIKEKHCIRCGAILTEEDDSDSICNHCYGEWAADHFK